MRFRPHSSYFTPFIVLWDALTIALAWYLAHFVRYSLRDTLFPIKVPTFFPQYFEVIWVPVVLTLLVFRYFEIYHPKRGGTVARELVELFQAITVSYILLLAFFYFFRKYEFSRLISLFFWIFSLIMVGTGRILLRKFIRFLRSRGLNPITAIIVGAGELGRDLAAGIESNPWMGIQILGFVDDEAKGEEILGKTDELEEIVKRQNPDHIYLSLDLENYSQIEKMMDKLAETTVSIRLVPDVHSLPTLRHGMSYLGGFPLLHLTDSPLEDPFNRFLKRSFDILVSIAALIFFSPLFLLLAILIKVTSSGPIFYRQKRMGLDGKTFMMIKFRTMKVDAESETGPVWASKDDQRTTGVGKVLRRTSLDELPQLWNVLKGEMSIVGPRPERPVFIEKFKKEIPQYMHRHKMKAGITGWAQVNGWRGNTSLQKRIEHDLYYIENWSLAMDIKIILLTIIQGFINKNAY